MANLGAEVEFVTMLDDDSLGREARLRLRGAGVKLTHAVSTPDKGMGMWLAVFNEKGDLAGSVSHMPDASPIERLFEERGEEIIRSVAASRWKSTFLRRFPSACSSWRSALTSLCTPSSPT